MILYQCYRKIKVKVNCSYNCVQISLSKKVQGFICGTVVSRNIHSFIKCLSLFCFLIKEAFIDTYCMLGTVLRAKKKKTKLWDSSRGPQSYKPIVKI